MGGDTKANTRGGGALELGDSRLFEDGSERGGALVSDVVVLEAAKHGGGWGSERRGVSMGADTRANTMGWCALERGHHVLLEPLAQLGDPLSGVGAAAFIIEAAELVPAQAATGARSVNGR